MARAAIILAAGQGTRMKSAKPKVMHTVAGLPILGHVIAALRGAGVERIVVVLAPGAAMSRRRICKQGAETVVQDKQLGTGHAAACAREALKDFAGTLVVTYGDMPIDHRGDVRSLVCRAGAEPAWRWWHSMPQIQARTAACMHEVRTGCLDRIVEYKDASAAERQVDLCNAGILAAEAKKIFPLGGRAQEQQCPEGILPHRHSRLIAKADGVRMRGRDGRRVRDDGRQQPRRTGGGRSRDAAALARACAGGSGVGMTAPETVFFSHDTVLEPDAQIEPLCRVRPGRDGEERRRDQRPSRISKAPSSRAGAIVGPYARLRPGAEIGERRPYRQFRRSEERQDRQRAPRPTISPIWAMHGSARRQYRRWHHHLQL